jgi:hypothetical protein
MIKSAQDSGHISINEIGSNDSIRIELGRNSAVVWDGQIWSANG